MTPSPGRASDNTGDTEEPAEPALILVAILRDYGTEIVVSCALVWVSIALWSLVPAIAAGAGIAAAAAKYYYPSFRSRLVALGALLLQAGVVIWIAALAGCGLLVTVAALAFGRVVVLAADLTPDEADQSDNTRGPEGTGHGG